MPERSQQEQLVLIADQTGNVAVPDLYSDDIAVDLIEQSIHLQNAITYLSAVSMRQGFIDHDNNAIDSHRTHAPASMRAGVERRRAEFSHAANESFVKATGNEAMLKAGLITPQQLSSLNRSMFSDFLKKYLGTRHYAEAQAYRRQLASRNQMLADSWVSQAHRREGIRPYQSNALELPKKTDQPELPTLNTRQRLEAIKNDPRAGFLPTTNQEKNQVLAYLDYLDNPKYPLGIANQFNEVYNFSLTILRRPGSNHDPRRGPESLVYEMGDYLSSATQQLAALEDLAVQIVESPNRKITLTEELDWIDLGHPGFASLIRFRDLSRFSTDESQPDIFRDILRTKPYRWSRTGQGPHKQIEDQYTAETVSQDVKDYINEQVAAMTVGEARDLIFDAIKDQVNRQSFMMRRLEEIANFQGRISILDPAIHAAGQILGESRLAIS